MLVQEDQCNRINLYSNVFTRIYALELHDFNNNMAGTLLSSFVLAYYPFYATFPPSQVFRETILELARSSLFVGRESSVTSLAW